MSILVIGEHDNTALRPSTLNVVTAAKALGSDIDVLIAGSDCQGAADEAATIAGVARVLKADDAALSDGLAENMAPLVQSLAGNYSHVLAPATTYGKNLLPRAAAILDVQQISDISGIESEDTFVRPIYAGNAMATVRSNDALKLITVRTTSFEAAEFGGAAPVEEVSGGIDAQLSTFAGEELTRSERPELTTADIIVSGGRGMQSSENFAMLETLADKLGAAVGASRAAVDAGYVPNDYQVGQTGKVVAPNVYIAVGISGAIQHLAGMKDSKIIVARWWVADGSVGLIQNGFKITKEEARSSPHRQSLLEEYLRNLCTQTALFPGIRDVLAGLEKRNIPWGIVTNKPQRFTKPLLAALGLDARPGSVVSGDTLSQSKPHPAPLQLACEEMGVPPDGGVMIGDDLRDIDAGRASGMRTIAVTWGYRPADQAKDWGADRIALNPAELFSVMGL